MHDEIFFVCLTLTFLLNRILKLCIGVTWSCDLCLMCLTPCLVTWLGLFTHMTRIMGHYGIPQVLFTVTVCDQDVLTHRFNVYLYVVR